MKNKMLFLGLSVLLVFLHVSPYASAQNPIVRFTPAVVTLPAVGKQFTVEVVIENGRNVAGYQVMLLYDPDAVKAVGFRHGDYLPADAFFGRARVLTLNTQKRVRFAATASPQEITGDGVLGTLTFEVISHTASSLSFVRGNRLTNSGTLLSNKDGTVSFPNVENAIAIGADASETLTTHESKLVLPPNLISEAAFAPNATYFIFNAQFPTLTDVDNAESLYRECRITLDLPGVPAQPRSDHLDAPGYFMFPLKTPQERLDELDGNAYLRAIAVAAGTTVTSAIATAKAGALIGTVIPVKGNIIGAGIGFLIGAGVSVVGVWNEETSAEDVILQATADPFFELLPSESEEDVAGRPTGSTRFLFFIPRQITDIRIKVEQEYSLKSVPRNPVYVYTAPHQETWDLEVDASAAPAAQLMSLSDYPPFQQLPPEAQEYLLRHFGQFTNAETWRIPEQTTLLPNYPNPFNPETWIPYQLTEPADVTVTIHDTYGHVVRTLDVGHQRAGIYQSRNRAAYWDGKNTQGEPIASGVYFYTLSAGDFTATRKMLITK